MDLQLSRLRTGEWMVGVAAFVLIASTFLKWYALTAPLATSYQSLGAGSGSADAWTAMTIVSPVILLVGLVGLAAFYAQATCRAPALPVCLTTMLVPLSLLLSLILVNRVLLNHPGASSQVSLKPGAVIGMLSAFVMLIGAWASIRQDGIRRADGPAEIETFRRRPRVEGAH